MTADQAPDGGPPPARVIWDDQAPERAAIWYLGAFGAVGAVLLAGASIAGVDWTHAKHPVYALLLVVAAVVAAFTVVTVASLVIYPGCTSVTLRNRQNKVEKRIRRKTGAASGAITWDQVAAEDNGVLAALYVDAAFQDSPDTLWAGAHGRGNSRQAARDQADLKAMVDAANSWLARKRFKKLRILTPIAAVIVLAGGLAWRPLTAPPDTAPPQPAPVLAELALMLKGQGALTREQINSLDLQNQLLTELNRLLLQHDTTYGK